MFVVALIHCDVANPESDRYCCIDTFVKKVNDLNLLWLTKNLIYGLLFETSDALLANTLQSLNYVLKLLLEQPSRVTMVFVDYILLFIFIYDSNINFVPTSSILRRGNRESIMNHLPMKAMESLLTMPFDLVEHSNWVIVTSRRSPSTKPSCFRFSCWLATVCFSPPSFLCLIDCNSMISLLESVAKEAETTDDTVKEVFALSSLAACYSADMMSLIRHTSEDAYTAIMRLYCKALILKDVLSE